DVFTERDVHVLELLITRLNYVYWMEHGLPARRFDVRGTDLDNIRQESISRQEPAEPLIEPLTPREMEVLAALAAGYSNKEIADRLDISEATVKTHVY